MKSLLTILMVALIGTAVNANPGSKGDYLVTKDGKLIVAKVHLGMLNVKAIQENGEKVKVSFNNVESFKMDGETYSRKPLFNDKHYEGMVFMKKIAHRNSLGLYCYEDPLIVGSDNKRYFVYKDETTFWLEVEYKSAENIKNFFNRM